MKLLLTKITKPDEDALRNYLEEALDNVNRGDIKTFLLVYEKQDGTIETRKLAKSGGDIMCLCNLVIHQICRNFCEGA